MRNAWFGGLVLAAITAATGVPALATAAEPGDDDTGALTRVIVTTDSRAATRSEARTDARDQVTGVGGSVRHVYTRAMTGYAATVPAGQVDDLRDEPGVVAVEPDQRVFGATTQNPVPSWGLSRIDQRDLPLDQGYTYDSTGDGVTVYVLDSGVRSTHQEFSGRLRMGPAYADDATSSEDCHGHGTHVAGTVGGTTFGVAKQVDLVSVRVLDCNNAGWYSDWIAGIDWINGDHGAGEPAVVNASLGGGLSTALNNAVAGSIGEGIVWAIAAMNDDVDACTRSPAAVPAAITVGAVDSTDTRASFSDYGSCVDLFAPGVDIDSAGIGSDTAEAEGWNGTSMATPHVAGAAARYLQMHPSATPAQVWTAMLADTTTGKVGDPQGSPNRLLYAAPSSGTTTAPSTPTSVSATTGSSTTATLSWQPPTSTGGSPITGYYVARNGGTAGQSPWSTTVAASARSHAFANLRAGATYTLSVAAINATGTGPASTIQVTMPTSGVPGAATNVAATATGSTSANLTWTPPTSNGGSAITGYRVARDGGTAGQSPWSKTLAASARRQVFANLRAGATYTLSVAAINARGTGPTTSLQVTMPAAVTAPGAPVIGTASPGASGGAITATAAWSPPSSTGGSAITGYRVRALRMSSSNTVLSTTTSAVQPATARSLSMTLPTRANYRFTVQAINAVGAGAQSARSNLVAGR